MIVEIRSKAVDVALSLASGAYQTSLVSYFAHRDLFPALIKVTNYARLALSLVSTIRCFSISGKHFCLFLANVVECSIGTLEFLRYRLIARFLAVHTRL